MTTNPASIWPGGIPENVRFHPEPFLGDVAEEIKGWQLFIEDACTARSTGEQDDAAKADRRRDLVRQWATLTQEDRDAYQSRAPVQKRRWWYPEQLKASHKSNDVGFVSCIVPKPLSTRNRALWTKLRIMLYHLDGDDGFVFGEDDGEVAFPEPNPAGPGALTPENLLERCYIESADFDHIAMTSSGTVICHTWQSVVLFADQEALDTGLMLLCHIENNGQVMCQGRVWPVVMKDAYVRMTALGKPVSEIIESDQFNQNFTRSRRVDMELPIVDILESKARYMSNPDIDLWLEAIERCAPGYLELEEAGNGMVPDYDHASFRSHQELEQMAWNDES